jgi:hypothetical protein
MWHCGYEGEQMREAFRVCSGITDIGSWPSERYRERWMALTSFLQNLCDQCLGILLDREIRVRLATAAVRTRCCALNWHACGQETVRCLCVCVSVCLSVYLCLCVWLCVWRVCGVRRSARGMRTSVRARDCGRWCVCVCLWCVCGLCVCARRPGTRRTTNP